MDKSEMVYPIINILDPNHSEMQEVNQAKPVIIVKTEPDENPLSHNPNYNKHRNNTSYKTMLIQEHQ
jgi:hypothetical protein